MHNERPLKRKKKKKRAQTLSMAMASHGGPFEAPYNSLNLLIMITGYAIYSQFLI